MYFFLRKICWNLIEIAEDSCSLFVCWVFCRVSLILQNVPDWLHNGCHAAIICQSHPKQISEFYFNFWPLAPHIGRAVGVNGKTVQKWPKKYQLSKLAENPSKSGKRLKPNAIPSFLGDVGLIKVVLEFSFGHPKCHFLMGTFGKSAHLYVPKNGTSGARTKN